MKSLAEQLKHFDLPNQKISTLAAHYAGLPAILISLLLLLNWLTLSFATSWHITFAWIAIVLSLVYYSRLNFKLALLMTVLLILLNLICYAIAFPRPTSFGFTLFLTLFIGGCTLQFIGNNSTKKLTFCNFLTQLTIGPLFLLIKILKALKLDQHFDVNQANSTQNEEKTNESE